ncbi:MAG TPA: ADOP family duplicated permease, partial [Vicinamibacterales bacterium]|nr:ADOP family duplicated permease [Vicinamibacterales bacterium]
PRGAELDSLKDFGNVAHTREAARRVWTPWWLAVLHDQASDVRYAVRALAKHPAFSLTVVGVLTLGIGLNAAVFTMLKGLALTPIAGVDGSSRLVSVFRETSSGRPLRVSYPDYQFLRDNDRAFNGLMGSIVTTAGLGRDRASRSMWAEIVTGNYFQVLGVRAQRGRTLLPSDEIATGRHPVVVISDSLWRRDFEADPGIIGRTIEINSYPMTVVGITDPAFHGTTVVYDVELYLPVMMAPQLGFNFGSAQTTASGILSDARATVFIPQGYLRPGTTLASAAAQIDALGATLARDRPLTETPDRMRTVAFWKTPGGAPGELLPMVGVLAATGLLVLLIACANIAGLVLVRGMSRRGEIALRLALGATRARIVRLLIVENLVLAVPGVILGVVLAARGIPVLVSEAGALLAPQRFFVNMAVDRLVIAYAALVGVGSAVVFGIVPALQGSRVDLVSVMSDVSPRGTARGRLRAGLVVAQVAVSLLLLVGSGLVARSLEAARQTYPGYDANHATSVSIDVKQSGYDEARGRVFYRQLLDAVRSDAGTESVTIGAYEPMAFTDTPSRRMSIDGYSPRRGEDLAFLSNTVGPDYFRTLKIDVVAGRAFESRDDENATPVAMVNNTCAQRFWGSAANAVGKRIRNGEREWRTVIGVAADIKYLKINESPRSYIYLPFLQLYRPNMVLHSRGRASGDVLVDEARARIAALDANLPVLYGRPLVERMKGATLVFNLTASMLFVFGIAGIALAAMGTYGLIAYTVKQNTHEIGIRMALGASRLSVVRGFLARGLRLGGIGAGLGLAAALAVTRWLSSALFGVSATDVSSFARALALVMSVVVVATLVPAWRASRMNPLSALRHQ